MALEADQELMSLFQYMTFFYAIEFVLLHSNHLMRCLYILALLHMPVAHVSRFITAIFACSDFILFCRALS